MATTSRPAKGPPQRMTHPWLPAPLFTMLCDEAVRRGDHVDKLAAQLLEAVIEDNLYGALLDR